MLVPQAGTAQASTIGHGSTADADWRQDGGDPGRSCHQTLTGGLNATAAKHLHPAWAAPAGRPDEQVGGAVVVDGTVLRSSGGPSGRIRRYDAVTGDDPPRSAASPASTSRSASAGWCCRPWSRGPSRRSTPVPGPRPGGATPAAPSSWRPGDAVYSVGERGVCAYAAADGAQRWCDAGALESPVHAGVGTGRLVRRLDLDVDAVHGDEPLLVAGDHVYFAAVQRLHAFSAA
ncbi:hypothetical protein [Dactylosporangium sp. NPDC049140]|uniref:hypothetical protein n=1 Tax=Dactylosporangium sp. NPDC049140 TaxID=3155647 RepID=UPI00340819A4